MMWFRSICFSILFVALFLISPSTFSAGNFHQASISGRAVQLDPTFAYYKDRSAESIASEVAVNGFECVHLIVLNENTVSRDLIDALHDWGLAVVYQPFISGVYQPDSLFPPGSDQWKMEFLNSESPYRFFSFVHEDFVQFTKQRVVGVLLNYPFDGITFPETHYPLALNALDREPGQVDYVDVSPAFQEAFKTATGNDAFPDFNNPADPHYFKTDTALYQALVEFRTRTILDFFDEVVNGPGGIRESCPDQTVGLWTIGISWPDFYDRLIEIEGDDPERMARKIKPDIQFIQTHHPDWTRSDLTPDYMKRYKPFLEAVNRGVPSLPVGLQMDLGSQYQMVKTPDWYREADRIARSEGFTTTTYYEFGLRGAIYFNPPQLKKTVLQSPKMLVLYFDQRLDPESGAQMVGRRVTQFLSDTTSTIQSATVDGNILNVTLNPPIEGEGELSLYLGGLSDLPWVRFDYPHYAWMIPDATERQGRVNSLAPNCRIFATLNSPGGGVLSTR